MKVKLRSLVLAAAIGISSLIAVASPVYADLPAGQWFAVNGQSPNAPWVTDCRIVVKDTTKGCITALAGIPATLIYKDFVRGTVELLMSDWVGAPNSTNGVEYQLNLALGALYKPNSKIGVLNTPSPFPPYSHSVVCYDMDDILTPDALKTRFNYDPATDNGYSWYCFGESIWEFPKQTPPPAVKNLANSYTARTESAGTICKLTSNLTWDMFGPNADPSILPKVVVDARNQITDVQMDLVVNKYCGGSPGAAIWSALSTNDLNVCDDKGVQSYHCTLATTRTYTNLPEQ